MALWLQDPSFPNTYSLHEALIKACEDSHSGGGAYAFVTPGGVRLFLEDTEFDRLVSGGSFQLVVGIDEVTTEKALEKLKQLRDAYSGRLQVFAFLHDTKGSLFHPKFSWFKKKTGGVVVLGSGNLTEKGLRTNREAFSVIEVDDAKIEEIEAYWESWLAHNEEYLRPVDDGGVLEKARRNTWVARQVAQIAKSDGEDVNLGEDSETEVEMEGVNQGGQTPDTAESEDLGAWAFADDDAVLVAEIPSNNVRWGQANFDKASFEGFFGAQVGNNSQRLLLRNVLPGGLLGEMEVRHTVSVASHNYRIELGAAAGAYPEGQRPIAVFIRVGVRNFLYVLAMPADDLYGEIRQFLDSGIPGTQTTMKRFSTTVEEVEAECPHLPFWDIPE